MDIHPSSTGGTSRAGTSRATGAAAARPERRSELPGAANPAADRVELSADVMALQQSLEAAPTGELSPERLRRIGERLASGHYDLPEARESILRGLIRELDSALG